jgi:Cu(I)/Ag(I) efflux system membrane fusion protein
MQAAMALLRWMLLVAVTALASVALYRTWGPLPDRANEPSISGHRYYCPMHPQIVGDVPGECPICHMALERLDQTRGNDHPASTALSPPGAVPEVVPVMLSLDRQQLGGVVSEPARREDLQHPLRAPAIIEAREGHRAEVRVRAPGFVERLAVRETGVFVAAGQVLAWVYSPQVFQAERELLTARRWNSQSEIAAAARQSLELFGMDRRDIDAMLESGEALRAVPLRAPMAGHVLRTTAVLGQYATPDNALYELADLSRVWAVASVWERDLRRVRVGTPVRFVSQGGVEREARVVLVEPGVSEETRAARVRLELANPGLTLRPGMYGEALFPMFEGHGVLTIPRDAVIDTGTNRYVFVHRDDQSFVPRSIRTGALVGERWEVLEGIAEGERVVSRGAFMVDSESRLRAALTGGGRP